MAEETKIAKSSKMIFQNITFFMRPCKERQELRPSIEKEGGKVTSKATTECYKLAEKGSLVSREGYITTEFVEDCISQGKLLDTDKYKVKPGTVARPDSEKSFNEGVSDDSMEHADNIQTCIREMKGRSKYTKEEDIAMITYLIEEQKYHEATGRKVWKEMEALKITSHTAESMNTHYRKFILKNLDKYKHDIDKSWVSKLTGHISTEKEPEFSFDALFPKYKKRPLEMVSNSSKSKPSTKDSPEKKNPNSPIPYVKLTDVVKKKPEERGNKDADGPKAEKTAEKKKLVGKDNTNSEKKSEEKIGPNKETNKNKAERKNKGDDDSDSDVVTLNDGRLTTKNGQYQEAFESFISSVGLKKRKRPSQAVLDDNNKDTSDTSSKKPKQQISPKKSVSQINGKNSRTGTDTVMATDKNSNRSDLDSVDKIVENLTFPVDNIADESLVISSPDSVDGMLSRYLQDCRKINKEDTAVTSSPPKSKRNDKTGSPSKINSTVPERLRQKIDSQNDKNKSKEKSVDCEKITSKNDRNNSKEKSDDCENDTHTSENSVAKRTRQSVVNENESSKRKENSSKSDKVKAFAKKADTSNKNSNSNDKTGSPRKVNSTEAKILIQKIDSKKDDINTKESSKRKENSTKCEKDTNEIDNPVAKRTRHSVANYLETCNEKSNSKKTTDIAKKGEDKVKKVIERSKEDENDDEQSTHKTSGAKKRSTRLAAKISHGNKHINLDASDDDDDDETGSEKSDGNDSPRNSQKQTNGLETSQERDNSKVQEVVSICKDIAEDYGISPGFVKQLLYNFSGDVNQAVHWLTFGPDLSEYQPWTESDDERLSSNNFDYLNNKYGNANVISRVMFLEGI